MTAANSTWNWVPARARCRDGDRDHVRATPRSGSILSALTRPTRRSRCRCGPKAGRGFALLVPLLRLPEQQTDERDGGHRPGGGLRCPTANSRASGKRRRFPDLPLAPGAPPLHLPGHAGGRGVDPRRCQSEDLAIDYYSRRRTWTGETHLRTDPEMIALFERITGVEYPWPSTAGGRARLRLRRHGEHQRHHND